MDLKHKKLNIIPTCYNNLNCQYCYIDRFLPLTENIFGKRQLAHIFEHFKSKGINSVAFIGGEPLMNTYRVMEMLKLGKNYFEHFSLLTNGLLLEKALLNHLVELGLDELQINLLSFNEPEYNDLNNMLKKVTIPKEIIKYANSQLLTVLYVPIFDDLNLSVLSDFDGFMQETNSTNITFLTTKANQFKAMDFYKNISATGRLIKKESHFEIYNTAKYNIGFLDIVSYISMEGRYYLYPDLKVRTSLSTLDSVYEIQPV